MKNWANSTKDRDYWRVLVNATLNLLLCKSWSQFIIIIIIIIIILTGKPTRMRPLERSRYKREDKTKMDLKEIDINEELG